MTAEVHIVNVAIVGPGAVGLTCAAALKRVYNHEPLLCGRTTLPVPIVVEQRDQPRVELHAAVLTDPHAIVRPVDLVLLCVKAHQTAAAKPWLDALCSPATTVAILQNGVEHVDHVRPLVAQSTLLPVVVHVATESTAPGRVLTKTRMRLVVPADPAAAAFASIVQGPSVEVEPTSDFNTAAWSKLCWNAVAGLMAAAGRTAEIYQDQSVADLARRLALECIHVGRAEGANIPDAFADDLLAQFQSLPPGSGSSILTDRLASRPLEWDARNGVIQRRGRVRGILTPVSDVLVPILAVASGDRQSVSSR